MIRTWNFISLFLELFYSKASIDTKRIESRGLLAVKIAQMYAVRSDLLGIEKCRQLQHLYEAASPIPWQDVKKVLEGNVSKHFWSRVVEIDEKPLATASLGQVHKATLDTGEQVVVKVIKPKAVEHLNRDLAAVKRLMRYALFFYPKLKRLADPIGTLAVIERLIRTELDLRNESQGGARLEQLKNEADNLAHLENLEFQKFFDDLCSERVAVSEHLPYKSVALGLKDGSFRYENLLMLFRIHGYFLFLKGEFHGDFHPGNVFFNESKFWFLDNANVECVDSQFTQGLLKFLGLLGERNFEEAAACIESLAKEPLKDATAFRNKFEILYAGFESGSSSLTNQMMETVKLCVNSGLEFPEGAFPVIKSLMYLDGMALQCAPEARLLDDVLSFSGDLQKK